MSEEAPSSSYYTDKRNPNYWGHFCWSAWEAQIESFPESNPTPEQQEELKIWMFLNFRHTPCLMCIPDALELFRKYPIVTTSQAAAKEWLYFIHNQVNKKMGKSELSSQEAHEHSDLVRHVNWTKVWDDLKRSKLEPAPSKTSSAWRSYGYMGLFLLLLVFVAVFYVWLRDTSATTAATPSSPVDVDQSANESSIFSSPVVK